MRKQDNPKDDVIERSAATAPKQQIPPPKATPSKPPVCEERDGER